MSRSNSNAAPLTVRHYVLAGSLAVTLAASMWASTTAQGEEPEATALPVRGIGQAPRPSVASAASSAPLRPLANAERSNPWASVERAEWAPPVSLAGWAPPAPPPPQQVLPPPPVPPAPPRAPAFGYQILGMLDDGVPKVLLAGPSNTLAVKVGDVIETQWRVEKITPTGLHLTWVPGEQPQIISFRSNP